MRRLSADKMNNSPVGTKTEDQNDVLMNKYNVFVTHLTAIISLQFCLFHQQLTNDFVTLVVFSKGTQAGNWGRHATKSHGGEVEPGSSEKGLNYPAATEKQRTI